uniref:NADH-ubiquinone oxidoreductase chain 2 n=1 Tax=Cyrtophora moluccensis TaxID=299645 RepID=A0A0D3RBB9_9ARAC|nr:NADH dehydrogenase subunit 2 [Cyrtophora moluccensis]
MYAQSLLTFFSFYIISIIMTISCSNWFLVWIGLEINMMSFIALMYSRNSVSVETCMKYFFIQSLGSGILMTMFYSEVKMFDFLLLSVLSYKMGGGPFYYWFPSICESLSWLGCFFLMTIQKVLPMMMISLAVSSLMWLIVIISMFVGAVGSMNQKSVKRLMAYSSIHHIGWMMMGNFLAESMWTVYLLMYSMLLLGIIWVLSKDKILEMGMLMSMSTKWTFALGMLSLGGMPPMLGFYLKWWMFYNLLMVDISVLVLMVMMSVLMFYVYLRISYSILMSSASMYSWMSRAKNKYKISMDFLYMMGLNLSPAMWLIMM